MTKIENKESTDMQNLIKKYTEPVLDVKELLGYMVGDTRDRIISMRDVRLCHGCTDLGASRKCLINSDGEITYTWDGYNVFPWHFKVGLLKTCGCIVQQELKVVSGEFSN